jgi:hypothetical protein
MVHAHNFFHFVASALNNVNKKANKHKDHNNQSPLVFHRGATINNNINQDNNNPAEILPNSVPPDDSFVIPPTRPQSTNFDSNECIYIVFDLETTGRSTERHNIIKLACELVDCSGNVIQDTKFSS